MINYRAIDIPFIPSYRSSMNNLMTASLYPVMRHRPADAGKALIDDIGKQFQPLARCYIASATGVETGQAIGSSHIHRYLLQPSALPIPASASGRISDALNETKLNEWAEKIRNKNASVLYKGSAAWADALMREVFPPRSPELPSLPIAVYQAWTEIGRTAFDCALAAGVDYVTLDRFYDRILMRFLFDTLLQPKLSVDPSQFPEPRPSPERIRKDLEMAFESHAVCSIKRLTVHVRSLLAPAQKAQLERLCKERKVMVLLGENAQGFDVLGGLKKDFMNEAVDVLGCTLGDPAYAIRCLLEAYLSYPGRVHQDMLALELASGVCADSRLANKRAEFQVQHRRWRADLAFLTDYRSVIDTLGEHGKQYFLRMLQVLAQAAYRPSQRPFTLKSMLVTASLQTDVITEEAEPAQ